MIRYSVETQRGKRKYCGEDRIFINCEMLSQGVRNGSSDLPLVVAVCDGVGGESGGDIASTMTAASFFCLEQGAAGLPGLVGHLADTNLSILGEQDRSPCRRRMATTVAGLMLHDQDVIVFNLGDTRVYEFGKGELVQLSHDHTVMQQKKDRDGVRYFGKENLSEQNTLTRYIGGRGIACQPFIQVKKISPGDTLFLVCSDGIYKYISEEEMAEILNLDISIRKKRAAIMQRARGNGSIDDMSLVIMEKFHSG